jgi:hypothetical protein
VLPAAALGGTDYLVHSVKDTIVDDEFMRLALAHAYCPTLFVVSGYRLALSNTWRPTPAELRLTDPEILARGASRIAHESIPERCEGGGQSTAFKAAGLRHEESAQGMGCGHSGQ